MNEELYTVSFGLDRNYNGRNKENGKIRIAPAGCGTLMDKATAEALCRVLRPKYPTAKVVEIFREERDDLAAHSLTDLGEDTGLNDLTELVERLLAQGFSQDDILLSVAKARC